MARNRCAFCPTPPPPAKYTPPADARWSGHLLFVRETTLMAQPFEPDTLRLTGEVFPGRTGNPILGI